MANDPVKSALAGAKSTLAKANDFTRSSEGKNPGMFAPKAAPKAAPVPAPAPKSSETGLSEEAHSAGEGIKARMENENAARKVLGSFKKGGKVKKTGLYKLHEGEEVMSKDDVKKKNEEKVGHRAASVLGGKGKKGRKGPRIHLSQLSSGHIVAEHQPEPGAQDPTAEPEKHAFNDVDELTEHLREHYKDSAPEAQMEEPAAEPQGE
jgi:hypothetical protein